MIIFQYDLEQDYYVVVRAMERRRLGGPKTLPFAQWGRLADAQRRQAVMARIHSALDEDAVGKDGQRLAWVRDDALMLHPDLIASLSDAQANALGIPPATLLRLELQSESRLDKADFSISSVWARPGGMPSLARRRGAFLDVEGVMQRIPDPLYSIAQSVEAFAVADRTSDAERFKAVADLKAAFPDELAEFVRADGYLQDLRVYYATAFSLNLTVEPDGLNFSPVLFGRDVTARDDGAVDETDDSLLPQTLSTMFANDRFRRLGGDRAAYPLNDGAYVFIDPDLRPALGIVRRMQDADAETRRRFVSNPRLEIKAHLGPGIATDVVERLFVETEQFSARVTGADFWRTVVLAWIKPKPNSWLPEKFGLKCGDQFVEIAPSQVQPAVDALADAIDQGRNSIEVGGQNVPATPQALEAMQSLLGFTEASSGQRPLEAASDEKTQDAPPALAGKLFLTVHENFEDVSYRALKTDEAGAVSDFEVPAAIQSQLKPHQAEGVKWLAQCLESPRRGALLADDMGLGKTLQAIAFMAHIQARAARTGDGRRPFLVVAPTALLLNWDAEIRRHLRPPYLGEVVMASGKELRSLRSEGTSGPPDIIAGRSLLDVSTWSDAGLVLTTYETMRDYHLSFARSRFGLLVFDEIQKLKNPTSQMARAARTLNADFVLGLTGTPVENRIEDYWAIGDVLTPGEFGSNKNFSKEFGTEDRDKLTALRKRVSEPSRDAPPFMLRRMKEDISEGLPKKTIVPYDLPMIAEQLAAYDRVLARAMAVSESGSKGTSVLEALHQMRGVSLHPMDFENTPLSDDEFIAKSAKLNWLISMLSKIKASNEKALVFVESLAMQERLADVIKTRFGLSRRPMRIHGSVPGAKRQELVDTFQSEKNSFDVMLLSPKAGGVGLTITAANHVIHLSRWWNPAVEDQATDRIYRIGQEKEVTVHVPLAILPDDHMADASFDQKLHQLLERKRGLSRDMLMPPELASDIGELFASVVKKADASTAASRANGADKQDARASEYPKKKADSAQAALIDLPKPFRKELRPGELRDLPAIFAPIRGSVIERIDIEDPYLCVSPDNLTACITLLKAVSEITGSLRLMRLRFRSADWMRDKPPSAYPSEQRQCADIRRQVRESGVLAPKGDLILLARDRRGDFHDRKIRVVAKHGERKAEHLWDLAGGVDRLMDQRRETTINYSNY